MYKEVNQMHVTLSEEQTGKLKQYIFDITSEGIAEARKAANLDQPFLKQKYMAQWLGISVNTLKSFQAQGMPVIIIDGITLYSKKEVSSWLLKHQK